jgi:hypothetical protein
MTDRPLVLYHGPGCADGWTAAYCAWRRFQDDADYVPVQYGQDPPDVRGREVYVLDFSYRADLTAGLAGEASKLVVLDHHESAEKELAVLQNLSQPIGNLTLRFDMKKSGARLAWEYFCAGAGDPPFLVELVEDRDLWRWKIPYSRELNAWLRSQTWTFLLWDEIAQSLDRPTLTPSHTFPNGAVIAEHWGMSNITQRACWDGAAILRTQAQQVDAICQTARPVTIGGHSVLAANTPILQSEVCEKLADGRAFGASWYVRADGKKAWSLRSRKGGVNVADVARIYGGGGHPAAAGYEEEVA